MSEEVRLSRGDNPEDPNQLVVTIKLGSMGQAALANGDQPATPSLQGQRFRTLLPEQGGQQLPAVAEAQTAAAQYGCFGLEIHLVSHQSQSLTLLSPPMLQQKHQQHHNSGSDRVTDAFHPPCKGQELSVAVQNSSNIMLCRMEQVFAREVSNFVNNSRMLGIYYDTWYRSSNGDTPNICAVVLSFTHVLDKIIVTDAVCNHVRITLNKSTLEDVIWWLRSGLAMCDNIKLAHAKVLVVRLKRRIACIYFRQGMLKEARQEIDEVEGIIKGLLNNCVDVGIADSYWLLAWIRLFEVWDNESQLTDAFQDILRNAERALDIAQQLPNEDLKHAYTGRISCNVACLKLLLASCSHFQCEFRERMVKEANDLVNKTSQYTLAKRDLSLWCRAKLWLSLVCGEPSEQILSQIIAECRGVDKSNDVFIMLSAYHHDIECALSDGGDDGGSGN